MESLVPWALVAVVARMRAALAVVLQRAAGPISRRWAGLGGLDHQSG